MLLHVLAILTNKKNYNNEYVLFIDGAGNAATTPTGSVGSAAEAIDELAGLTLEEQQKQREEWNIVGGVYIWVHQILIFSF